MPRLSIKMSLNELFIWVAAIMVAMISIFKIMRNIDGCFYYPYRIVF